jgi:TctA family transporter
MAAVSGGYAGLVMRATLAYTSARIVLLVVSAVLLYLAGARGLLLLLLAFVVSGIVSFVLLSRQRDRMSGSLMTRLKSGRPQGPGWRARLEEGARAEDQD